MTVLITGAAGFIGYHLSLRLLERGAAVVGFDNVNPYYDPSLKRARIAQLESAASAAGTPFQLIKADLEDQLAVEAAFQQFKPQKVVNLAAQAGVRYSIENPAAYIQSNMVGFGHVLEGCRQHDVEHLVYASSSSVYGGNTRVPFAEHHSVDHPVSLYAASKKTNELMAHAYSHLYGLPATGLRFFTVYGPWGRPDMAIWKFVEAIYQGTPIKLFNNGNMKRDFTFIDDVTEAIVRLSQCCLERGLTGSGRREESDASQTNWQVFNIGNRNPVSLEQVVEVIERVVGKKAIKTYLPIQPGDVEVTCAEMTATERALGFTPTTSLEDGVAQFVQWFFEYQNAKNPSGIARVAA